MSIHGALKTTVEVNKEELNSVVTEELPTIIYWRWLYDRQDDNHLLRDRQLENFLMWSPDQYLSLSCSCWPCFCKWQFRIFLVIAGSILEYF